MTYIYLVELGNNQVYIGKTKNINNRKSPHRRKYGKNITLTIIDQVSSLNHKDWKPIETMWIQTFIGWGFKVMNERKEGGNGPSEYSWTEDKKQKQSILLSKPKCLGNQCGLPKPVYQFDINGNFITKWDSAEHVRKSLGIQVGGCCNGLYKTTGGYIWSRSSKINIKKHLRDLGKPSQKVLQYDKQGNFIKEWKSVKQASNFYKVSGATIRKVCRGKGKTCKGYIWKYKK